MKSAIIAVAALAASVYAKTDLAGCTSSASGATLVWYDPTNGELCELLDCGGGRAPPKTTVPGCAAYEGTETYSPKYLPGWGEATSTAESTPLYTATVSASQTGLYPVETPSLVKPSEDISSTPLTSLATVPYPTGTGIFSSTASVHGGNNVTATGKPTATGTGGVPESTGAAALLGVAKGVVGLAAGIVGIAML